MEFVRSTIGDPDLRSPWRVRLRASPSAKDDTEAEMVARSLDLRRIAGLSALFFSIKLIKKPSPVGEGGPR